jgi:hypothetical protein
VGPEVAKDSYLWFLRGSERDVFRGREFGGEMWNDECPPSFVLYHLR